jgi:hypothetical protein
MTYTLHDAVQGWIRNQRAKLSPLHARSYNDTLQIWIGTLESGPTSLPMVELEIGRERRRRDKETEAALKWRISVKIDALEWLKGRIICQDFELWARAG